MAAGEAEAEESEPLEQEAEEEERGDSEEPAHEEAESLVLDLFSDECEPGALLAVWPPLACCWWCPFPPALSW